MGLEYVFAAGVWDRSERDDLVGRIESAREEVVRWWRSEVGEIDPHPSVDRVVVSPLGRPSHVDHEARSLFLLVGVGRSAPLIHEWVHAYGPSPTGGGADAFLREGLATWLQERLSPDPVFPLGKAGLAALARGYGPNDPMPGEVVERAVDAFEGRAFAGEADARAARWRTYVYAGLFVGWLLEEVGCPARIVAVEAPATSDPLGCIAESTDRSASHLLQEFGALYRGTGEPGPEVEREVRADFARWRALPWKAGGSQREAGGSIR